MLNKLLLPVLFLSPLASFANELNKEPPFFESNEKPALTNEEVLKNYSDGSDTVASFIKDNKNAEIKDKYINGLPLILNEGATKKTVTLNGNSFSIDNSINSIQLNAYNNTEIRNNNVEGNIKGADGKVMGGFIQLNNDSKSFDTVVNQDGSLSVRNDAKAYGTTVNSGGTMIMLNGNAYAQNVKVNGGTLTQSITGFNTLVEDVVVNSGQHIIYAGTSKNVHLQADSYQLVSGNSINTHVYKDGVQNVMGGQDDDSVIYEGGHQVIVQGTSNNTEVYGTQILSGYRADWDNNTKKLIISDELFNDKGEQFAKNVHIYEGGTQIVQTGNATGSIVDGTQIISGKKGSLIDHVWVEQDGVVGLKPTANDSVINKTGKQQVENYGFADNTQVKGGTQIVNEFGEISNTTIDDNGSSFIHNGALSSGTMNVNQGSLSMEGGEGHEFTADIGAKGAYAENVTLANTDASLFIVHNADATNSDVTIGTLTNNGNVFFNSREGSSSNNNFNRLNIGTLEGSGRFIMNTDLRNGVGDFLNVTDKVDGEFDIKVLDSGKELVRNTNAVNPYHLIFAKESVNSNFTLEDGTVDLGAYKYYLVQGDTTDSDNWYLAPKSQEPSNPGGPNNSKPELSEGGKNAIAVANITPLIWDSELSTLRTRLGDLRDNKLSHDGVWGKYITARNNVSTDNVSYKQDINGFMLGADHSIYLDYGQALIGGMFSYTHSKLDADTNEGKVDSYGFGVYASFMHDNGYYADGVIKFNRFKIENNANFNNGKTSADDKKNGLGLSLEVGKYIVIDDYFVEPYLLGSFFNGQKTNYRFDSGMEVDAASSKSLKGELGTTFGKVFVLNNGAIVKPYVRLAVNHEFKKNNDVIINGTERFYNDMSGTTGKYGIGFTAQLAQKWSTYFEFNYAKGKNIETPYSGHLGLRYSF